MVFGEVTALIEAVPQPFITSTFCKTAVADEPNLQRVFDFFGGMASAAMLFTAFMNSKKKMAYTIQRQALLRGELMTRGATLTWGDVVDFFKSATAEDLSTATTAEPPNSDETIAEFLEDCLQEFEGPHRATFEYMEKTSATTDQMCVFGKVMFDLPPFPSSKISGRPCMAIAVGPDGMITVRAMGVEGVHSVSREGIGAARCYSIVEVAPGGAAAAADTPRELKAVPVPTTFGHKRKASDVTSLSDAHPLGLPEQQDRVRAGQQQALNQARGTPEFEQMSRQTTLDGNFGAFGKPPPPPPRVQPPSRDEHGSHHGGSHGGYNGGQVGGSAYGYASNGYNYEYHGGGGGGHARGGRPDASGPLRDFAAQYCVGFAAVFALVTKGQIADLRLAHFRRSVGGGAPQPSTQFGDFVVSSRAGGTSLEKTPPAFTQIREMDKAIDRMLACVTRFNGKGHPEVECFTTMMLHFKTVICVGNHAIEMGNLYMDAHFQTFGNMVERQQLAGGALSDLVFRWGGPEPTATFLSLKLDAMQQRPQLSPTGGGGGYPRNPGGGGGNGGGEIGTPEGQALVAMRGPGGEHLCWDNAINDKCPGATCPKGGKLHATGALLAELVGKLKAAGFR